MAHHQPGAPRRSRLTLYIFIALAAGIALGFLLNRQYISGYKEAIGALDRLLSGNPANAASVAAEKSALQLRLDQVTDPFSLVADIFLKLIKMIVAPLVFTTLVVGVAKLGDIKSVGRIGGKSLLWFFCASFLSLALGMFWVNFFEPGAQMHLPLPGEHAVVDLQKSAFSLRNFLGHVFTASIIDSFARNEILQIVVFSLLFGTAAAALGERAQGVIHFFEVLSEIILKITGYIMNIAPLAVFCAMTAVIAKQGVGILKTYSLFIGEFYLGLGSLWLVLLLIAFLFLGKKVFALMRRMKDPALLAFSTSSRRRHFPK
ncbi:MAG: cation:dicarboxylase symporter family transporter [Chitinophagaceae bacterium]